MIVNDRLRFVFIHVPKTGGTSVREALEALPGGRPGWTTRSKHETLADFQRHAHARVGLARRVLGPSLRHFFTCGFVRNPWDRMASLHRYLLDRHAALLGGAGCSLRDLLERLAAGDPAIRSLHSMRPQTDFLADAGGGMSLGFLGHHEHLAEDFAALAQRLCGAVPALGHANRSSHCGSDYRRAFDAASIDIVARHFAADIRHFGYEFERREPSRRVSGPLLRPR